VDPCCARVDFELVIHPGYAFNTSSVLIQMCGVCVELLPFRATREAGRAVNNFRSFMNEWFEEKKAKVEMDNKTSLKPPSGADLMGILISSNTS